MTVKGRRVCRTVALALAAAASGGCGEHALVTGLAREEAQRCAVVLRANGVDASVEEAAGGHGEYTVDVRGDDADYRTALRVLEAHGLPRRSPAGFSTASPNLIPSPAEERARFIKGLSGEIEGLLESIDGIVSAEVLVSVPERRPLAGASGEAATASAVIGHTGASSPITEDEARDVIVRAAGPNLEPSRVAIVLKPLVRADAPPVVRYERDRLVEAGFAAAVGLLAVLQALTVWRMRAARLRAATEREGHDAE
jgi:type III secretion protein J